MALHARTGADLPTAPQAVPLLVNEYAGWFSTTALYGYPADG
ncbi:hypothetical protein [Streptomyces sp. NRRL F-4428]|nr:hypothetical protein [Streptomyces sp. NRRL F-4428]